MHKNHILDDGHAQPMDFSIVRYITTRFTTKLSSVCVYGEIRMKQLQCNHSMMCTMGKISNLSNVAIKSQWSHGCLNFHSQTCEFVITCCNFMIRC